jgi:hypothetical protein
VCKNLLNALVGVVRAFRRPIAERNAEAVRRQIAAPHAS